MSVVPEAPASGAAPYAKPDTYPSVPAWWRRSTDVRLQAIARAARPDYEAWLAHVKTAAACTRPIRLAGTIATIEAATSRLLAERSTADMPDGVIYKPCGNRRESVCPSCSKLYQRDAYQVVRAGLVGGKGVPEQVAHHPAVFPTFTAPSFGEVHTRAIKRHTCARRKDCDCRPDPCHARRALTVCPHGVRLVCFVRHAGDDQRLGTPLCRDCYDYDTQAVWNVMAGELWRRTTIAIHRYLRRLARHRGIPEFRIYYVDSTGKQRSRLVPPWRLSFGKAAEMQRRGVVHFHAIIRLDGYHPDTPDAILPPPPGLDTADLIAAIDHTAKRVCFTTDPHPSRPGGWAIGWGDQVHTKVITVAAEGEVTDAQVAAYLAKYATKSTEITGHTSARLDEDTIGLFADPHGSHTERLIAACWRLGDTGQPATRPHVDLLPVRTATTGAALRAPWICPACANRTRLRTCPTCSAQTAAAARAAAAVHAGQSQARHRATDPGPRLRRWAHMLGFGGHFLTKSRRHSVTFALLREQRIFFRRAQTSAPEAIETAMEPTTLVVNFLQFVGAGWHTTADAMLANTSAAMAREHAEAARQARTTLAA
ncbi:plasmid replication initiator protein [Couchioplanes caeruleus subsp. caeruleus]|uniref:Plasmid replication initiator protein n=1 Tax=Couchioplanes caeruleus subsp. caeruleus TaxID=56427 RepID=A0A1K0GVA8_9ACTN|nr:plasmid replication initiator protein [Couchioplanes caeruleus subsp. caeruleus]